MDNLTPELNHIKERINRQTKGLTALIAKKQVYRTGKKDGKRNLPRETGQGGPHTSPFLQAEVIGAAQLDERIDLAVTDFFREVQDEIDACNDRKTLLLNEKAMLEARIQNPGKDDDTELYKLQLFQVTAELAAIEDGFKRANNRKRQRHQIVDHLKKDNHSARDQRLSSYWNGVLCTNDTVPPMPDIPGLVKLYSLTLQQTP